MKINWLLYFKGAAVTISLAIVIVLSSIVLTSPLDEYTITVHNEEWIVKDKIAQHIEKNGSTWTAEGIISWFHIYFPSDSNNRSIRINLEILDGTIDFLIFPNYSEFESYRYGDVSDGALVSWTNVTNIIETTVLEDREPIIAYRSNSGGSTVVGTIIASCVLN